ncbi:hypothetical protein EDB87DRAFT_1685765 [Lactarius vividus]|nr:hypothetical protein EDB87DRAFT_1685765 [Lactarius vividus]
MKRSSNRITPPNPPPSKQARQEHPSCQDEVQSPSRSLTVSKKTIKSLRSALQDISVSAPDWKEEIYFVVRAGLRKSVLKGSEGKWVPKARFLENLRHQEHEFLAVFKRARADNASLEESWAIATHRCILGRLTLRVCVSTTNPESQEKAVELSWSTEFIGHLPLVALETHIRDQMKLVETYARYCSIVQSSGMGKSQLKMPEVCHFHFTFVVLKPGLLGFPPADDVVRDFLTHVDKKNKNMHMLSLSRANHFFHALFLTTAEAFMSEDQSMSSSRPKRSRFYKDVITKATKGLAGADPSNADLKAVLEQLQKRINDGDSVKTDEGFLDIFVTFNEAHLLTTPFDENDRSNFVELRWALQTFSTGTVIYVFPFYHREGLAIYPTLRLQQLELHERRQTQNTSSFHLLGL